MPPAAVSPLARALESARRRVDRALDAWLPGERGYHPRLHESMRYSVMSGGKRLRPALVLLTGEIFRAPEADLMPAAAALEMIHTYSLIHDDLPAMDDDDYRRGRLSNHKAFGEAMAILAGDALLTLAFETVARRTRSADLVPELSGVIAEAAGYAGMVGGQAADIEASAARPDEAALEALHVRKTAALFSAAAQAGAIAGRASPAQVGALRRYGRLLGLAFQAADDILDVVGTTEALGKTAGKDEKANKLTVPAVLGLDRARAKARSWSVRAKRSVSGLGERARLLAELCDFVVNRTS